MVVRAGKERLAISEIPIHYHAREGESKLSSFRDGWRHLRFLLVHSPTHLFMLPGALMLALGALIALISLLQINVFGREWELHTMLGGALLMIVGVLVAGGAVLLVGIVIGAVIVVTWINRGFGELSDERLAVLAATLVIVGIQIFFTSFLLSILGLRRRA